MVAVGGASQPVVVADSPPRCIPWPLLSGWAVGSATEATMAMQWGARLAHTVTMVGRRGGYVRTMSKWLHTSAARWDGTTTTNTLGGSPWPDFLGAGWVGVWSGLGWDAPGKSSCYQSC